MYIYMYVNIHTHILIYMYMRLGPQIPVYQRHSLQCTGRRRFNRRIKGGVTERMSLVYAFLALVAGWCFALLVMSAELLA